MKFIDHWKSYALKNTGMRLDDEIVRVSVESKFDETKVAAFVKKYETADKYKGIEDFEWK